MRKGMFILTLSLLFLLSGIGVQAEELEIGYVTGDMGSEINVYAHEAFESFANEKNWDVKTADCQGDRSKYNDHMRNHVSAGVDAIVVFSGEDKLIKEGAEAAEEEDIPVFLADTENVESTVVNVTSNNWEMGALLGSQVVDRLNSTKESDDSYQVGIIGMPDLYVHRQREEMLKSIFESEENENIEIIGTQGVESEDEAYDIATTWINKHGEDLDAIIGTWDGIGWEISRAIRDAGYTREDIFTMSIDGVEQTYNMMRNGEPFSGVIAQNFPGWMKVIGQSIERVVEDGEDPEEFIPETRTIYVPHKWISENNIPEEGEQPDFNFEGLEE